MHARRQPAGGHPRGRAPPPAGRGGGGGGPPPPPPARREAEPGAQLLQRVGRGIRLTPAGELLADRAAEILGRIDAADAELSAHVGLNAGRVRLAGFASANGALVPAALATLAARYPSPGISPTDTHPGAA